MFGSDQGSTARHRATAENPVEFTESPAAHVETLPASPRRTPILLTLLVFAGMLLLLSGGWVLFGRGPNSSAGGPTGGRSPTGGDSTSTAPAGAARAPGLGTVVRLRPDGTLRTAERITLRRPQTGLVLSVPRRPGAAAQFQPSVTNVSIHANGRVQRRTDTLTTGEATTFQLNSPAARFVVRYSVGNAVRREPSASTRALALTTPVTVAGLGRIPSRVDVVSPHVLSIGCVSPRGVLATCGSRTGRGWQVRAQAGKPVPDVIAQVKLPG